ncbi:MAG: sensor histidine kinase, partial [Bacteroidota bacterium]
LSVPLTGEVTLMRTNGISFRASYNAIRFHENNLERFYFSFNDIDDNYKMQVALQESERINATLVSNLPGMVYRRRYDKSWTMTFVSFGVERLTGYHPPELLHNNIISYEELLHPDDKGWVSEKVADALRQKVNFDMQYRIINREGKVKWVWEQSGGIFSDSGDLLYLEGYIMDITREKEAGQALEFQTYFLRLIIDNIPFPLFYKDVNGVYTGCNNDFCQYLDLEKEKIEGHTVFDIFEEEQARLFHKKDMELLQNGGSQSYETEITFPDGRKMDAVFHKAVFYDQEQKPLGIIGIYFDITQRVQAEKVIKKQLEELGRINSELERFSYTVSHDLRSPLVTIKGFLGLLREDLSDHNQEQVEEDMLRIESATDKMQQLLEDLLKLSRIGKVVDQNERFSMSLAANEAHELLHGLMREKNCRIDIQQDMPEVEAGKARIRELFQNLLENAVKFTRHPDATEIKVFSRVEAGNDIFCVKDNGVGIDPRYHDKVFGLFNKLDATTPGTGLGLSLVKRIVDNHKGRIWIESDGKTGTTFCFTINTEKSSPSA